jgi:hypothetical protein
MCFGLDDIDQVIHVGMRSVQLTNLALSLARTAIDVVVKLEYLTSLM